MLMEKVLQHEYNSQQVLPLQMLAATTWKGLRHCQVVRVDHECLLSSNPFLLFAVCGIWRMACVNMFMLLPLNIVNCCGDALLQMCICHFYPFQTFFFITSPENKYFYQAERIFYSHRIFLTTPQRLSFMTLVKCVLVLIRRLSVLEHLIHFVMY